MKKQTIEYDLTLAEMIEMYGQGGTAQKLGIRQGAVWQMVRDKRQILVKQTGRVFKYAEIKKFRRGSTKRASR